MSILEDLKKLTIAWHPRHIVMEATGVGEGLWAMLDKAFAGAILGLLTAEKGSAYLEAWFQRATIHELLCLIGGFLWLAATVCYNRRSGNACPYCGRRDSLEGWTSPDQAARWSRIAGIVAMVAPIFYALTRYAWVLGTPLGMSKEALRSGQEHRTWIGGLALATFSLVGPALMLGLVQRWGEVFSRWMIGLAGRRVPIALAVLPAALASVLLVVDGIGIWSDLGQMTAIAAATGAEGMRLLGEIIFQFGPTLLFSVWGGAFAVATLDYTYRRRGPCKVRSHGALFQGTQQRAKRGVRTGAIPYSKGNATISPKRNWWRYFLSPITWPRFLGRSYAVNYSLMTAPNQLNTW